MRVRPCSFRFRVCQNEFRCRKIRESARVCEADQGAGGLFRLVDEVRIQNYKWLPTEIPLGRANLELSLLTTSTKARKQTGDLEQLELDNLANAQSASRNRTLVSGCFCWNL